MLSGVNAAQVVCSFSKLSLFLLVLLLCSSVSGFMPVHNRLVHSRSSLAMTNSDASSFKSGAQAALAKTLSLGAAAASVALLQLPRAALAGSLEDGNNKLKEYGLPPILFVPPGFQTIVSEFGRGNAKTKIENPIVVQFSAPNLWIAKKTSVNNNGESGTISANDYAKGDSAFLFTENKEPGQSLTVDNKAYVNALIQRSLSQKGDPLEAFKVIGLRAGPKGVDGREYLLADINYSLNTEAGFLIGRKGVVSMTSVGTQVQALVSVTTEKRWKTLEPSIRDIANTFRVYQLNSGIFSKE